MPKTLIHTGTQVFVSFAVLDENGNASRPPAVMEDGRTEPLPPRLFTLSRLDDAAFEELKAAVAMVREEYARIFCAEPNPDEAPAPPGEPSAAEPEPAPEDPPNPEPDPPHRHHKKHHKH